MDDEADDRAALEAGLQLLEERGYGERFRQLQEQPDEAIGLLRDDPDFQLTIVQADTLPRFERWFTPSVAAAWQYEAARSGPIGDASIGVEWSYSGTHDRDEAFNGVCATGVEVVVRGVTFVGVEEGTIKIRRYIDWAGLFGQLGLTLNWRIPVATLDDDGRPLAFLADEDPPR